MNSEGFECGDFLVRAAEAAKTIAVAQTALLFEVNPLPIDHGTMTAHQYPTSFFPFEMAGRLRLEVLMNVA